MNLIDLGVVINTLWIGLIYSLMAIPLTISYKVTRVLNFAHTSLVTVGAYVAVILSLVYPDFFSNVFVALIAAFFAGAIVAILNHKFVYRKLMDKEASPVILMIASLGSWIFLKYLIYSVISIVSKVIKKDLYFAVPAFRYTLNLNFLGISNPSLTYSLILGISLIVLTFVVFYRTSFGKAMRAVSDNPQLAQISGISDESVMTLTWFLCGGLAAISGVFWAMFSYASPEFADSLILQVFAACVIGGISSIALTILGGFVIAGAENILMSILYNLIGLDLSFRPFLSFLTLLIVILVRPPAGAAGGLPYRLKFKRERKWT
ncbi:MAG: branched-chain amino acid ABC transporter permease [Thermoproteota archaeon]|nr:branched-chain amino acid ABC transporter permease [Candidatus Brockarchaeota archaeon]MBO3762616.1 branched-chain amino acid ABC transporter permease [Candidatus Brockarchaeota archaeon]MBO3768375.1 branched-chain amino acid ABC transporter permease [Candidatus Brockarchaeota archaeon]MBO3800777.1 branched-chain amino acid ABC transporter permease [Candidatus Brockarchaeota archaeon]